MIRATITIAFAFAAGLAACQSGSQQAGGPRISRAASPASVMDGEWAATDGVFVASFNGGRFTSRFTKTNEVLAQGSYNVSGSAVTMEWLSVATQQQRSASCTITGSSSVRCEQSGGGGFDLRRTA